MGIKSAPDLYWDVDGVLFGSYGGYVQLRPYVTSCLSYAVKHFTVYWLTSWPEERLQGLFKHLQAQHIWVETRYRQWHMYEDKILAINPEREFYWVEDGISERAQQVLKTAGLIGHWYPVSPYGPNALRGVEKWLEGIVKHESESKRSRRSTINRDRR